MSRKNNPRRRFLALAGGALAASIPRTPFAAAMKRVGILGVVGGGTYTEWQTQLPKEFAALGWTVGRDLELVWYGVPNKGAQATAAELREGSLQRAREMAVAGLDCIIANGEPHARMLHEATSTVPIAVIVPDPVTSGFAKSLARPGGNMTGLHYGQQEVALKTAELLRRLMPATSCIAWIGIENFRPTAVHLEDAARKLGLRFRALSVKGGGPTDMARVREEMATLRREGCLTVVAEPPGREFTDVMAASAIEHRLALSGPAYRDGFLLAYYPLRNADQEDGLRLATLVSRILRGEKPGDIPFEGPISYRLEVNLRTAAKLGITVPVDVLTLADRLIR